MVLECVCTACAPFDGACPACPELAEGSLPKGYQSGAQNDTLINVILSEAKDPYDEALEVAGS